MIDSFSISPSLSVSLSLSLPVVYIYIYLDSFLLSVFSQTKTKREKSILFSLSSSFFFFFFFLSSIDDRRMKIESNYMKIADRRRIAAIEEKREREREKKYM